MDKICPCFSLPEENMYSSDRIPKRPLTLQNLPPEVLRLILAKLLRFKGSNPIRPWRNSTSPFYEGKLATWIHGPSFLRLVLVNNKFCKAAIQVFYGSHTFHFPSAGYLYSFVKKTSPARLQHIQHITFDMFWTARYRPRKDPKNPSIVLPKRWDSLDDKALAGDFLEGYLGDLISITIFCRAECGTPVKEANGPASGSDVRFTVLPGMVEMTKQVWKSKADIIVLQPGCNGELRPTQG